MDLKGTDINNGILKLGIVYVHAWQKNSAGQVMMTRLIQNLESVQNILVMCYGILVLKNMILPIEDIPVEHLDAAEKMLNP